MTSFGLCIGLEWNWKCVWLFRFGRACFWVDDEPM